MEDKGKGSKQDATGDGAQKSNKQQKVHNKSSPSKTTHEESETAKADTSSKPPNEFQQAVDMIHQAWKQAYPFNKFPHDLVTLYNRKSEVSSFLFRLILKK